MMTVVQPELSRSVLRPFVLVAITKQLHLQAGGRATEPTLQRGQILLRP